MSPTDTEICIKYLVDRLDPSDRADLDALLSGPINSIAEDVMNGRLKVAHDAMPASCSANPRRTRPDHTATDAEYAATSRTRGGSGERACQALDSQGPAFGCTRCACRGYQLDHGFAPRGETGRDRGGASAILATKRPNGYELRALPRPGAGSSTRRPCWHQHGGDAVAVGATRELRIAADDARDDLDAAEAALEAAETERDEAIANRDRVGERS